MAHCGAVLFSDAVDGGGGGGERPPEPDGQWRLMQRPHISSRKKHGGGRGVCLWRNCTQNNCTSYSTSLIWVNRLRFRSALRDTLLPQLLNGKSTTRAASAWKAGGTPGNLHLTKAIAWWQQTKSAEQHLSCVSDSVHWVWGLESYKTASDGTVCRLTSQQAKHVCMHQQNNNNLPESAEKETKSNFYQHSHVVNWQHAILRRLLGNHCVNQVTSIVTLSSSHWAGSIVKAFRGEGYYSPVSLYIPAVEI